MSSTAQFQLTNYLFKTINLDFENEIPKNVDVNFDVQGVYKPQQKLYDVHLTFTAFPGEDKSRTFITIKCIGTFQFQNVEHIDDIPDYFYSNSVAILFPYIRASVSILTNQANIPTLVLPTFNLIDLQNPLRNNTTIE